MSTIVALRERDFVIVGTDSRRMKIDFSEIASDEVEKLIQVSPDVFIATNGFRLAIEFQAEKARELARDLGTSDIIVLAQALDEASRPILRKVLDILGDYRHVHRHYDDCVSGIGPFAGFLLAGSSLGRLGYVYYQYRVQDGEISVDPIAFFGYLSESRATMATGGDDVDDILADPATRTDAPLDVVRRILALQRRARPQTGGPDQIVVLTRAGAHWIDRLPPKSVPAGATGPLGDLGAMIETASIKATHFTNSIEPVGLINIAPDGNGEIITTKTQETVFNQNDKKLYVWNGTDRYVRKISNLDFVSGVKAVERVTSLPGTFTNYPEGTVVYLTTDGKLYRSTGAAWSKAVDGADITAHSVTANQIAALTISASEIAANAVIAGKINTDAVTAGCIAAGAIRASDAVFDTAAIQSADINSLVASKISAGTISAAVSMTSPSLTITSGTTHVYINATDKILVTDSSVTASVQVLGYQVEVGASGGGTVVSAGAVTCTNPSRQSILDGWGLTVGGNQVVGIRGATIADPSGGGTQDAEARTAIAAIIDRLQAHGLIS